MLGGIKNTICRAEIATTSQEDDYMDIDLTIEFKDGPLKGIKYKLLIDLEDGEIVF